MINEELVLNWILEQEDYPLWTHVILAFGNDNIEKVDKILSQMRDKGDIFLDDGEILVSKITNPKLDNLVGESRRI